MSEDLTDVRIKLERMIVTHAAVAKSLEDHVILDRERFELASRRLTALEKLRWQVAGGVAAVALVATIIDL
jgi:hypothetical protein